MRLKRFDRANGNESIIDSRKEPRLVKRAIEIIAENYNMTPDAVREEFRNNPGLQLRTMGYIYQLAESTGHEHANCIQ